MQSLPIQPFKLNNSRIIIRPPMASDAEPLNRATTQTFDQLHEWMDWAATCPTIEDTKAYLAYSQKCWEEKNPRELPFLIFDITETTLIGATSYHGINWNIPMFEIGYWVSSEQTGRGYITDAVTLLTRYAFDKLNAKRVEIRSDSENSKSIAIPKRLGFQLEAHFKNHRIRPGSGKISGTMIFARYDTVGLLG
jgi:ribosomal-protein-serine acetyltransferase